jgi:hypothetical protein
MSISDDHFVVWEMLAIHSRDLLVNLHCSYIMLITPQLSIATNASVQVQYLQTLCHRLAHPVLFDVNYFTEAILNRNHFRLNLKAVTP